ncbi:hypothetical protein BX666DRAFT_1919450 [Dichotomocladium elegans]|nr:hypothetical protein BX666DRAFT_1919450 [Dichotomocladium elegans]
MRLALILSALATISAAFVVSEDFRIQHQEQPEWDARADVIRDTVETFYRTVVDDVLSTHTEDLLVRLTQTPRPKRLPLLRSQSQSLGNGKMEHTKFILICLFADACIAKLPSFIGHQIRQQHNRVIEILPSTVDEALTAVWPEYRLAGVIPIAQFQVASMSYSINLAVSHRLRQTIETFNLLDRLYEDLAMCESSFSSTAEDHQSSSIAPSNNNYVAYIANFGYRLWHRFAQTEETDERFLQTYLLAIKADLRSELEARVGEMVMAIYGDLYSRDDEDF